MGAADVAGEATGLELTGLRRYPVKSCRGEDLDSCAVEPWGLAGDRRWMVVDPAGKTVTAREANRLVLVDPQLTDRGLRLTAPDMADLVVERPDTGPLLDVRIWETGSPPDWPTRSPPTGSALPSVALCDWSTWTTRTSVPSTPATPNPTTSSPSPMGSRCCWPPRSPWPR